MRPGRLLSSRIVKTNGNILRQSNRQIFTKTLKTNLTAFNIQLTTTLTKIGEGQFKTVKCWAESATLSTKVKWSVRINVLGIKNCMENNHGEEEEAKARKGAKAKG